MMKPFRGPDGTWWGVEVSMPSHSNAMVIFHHPTGERRLDRYGWINARDAGANDPSSVLSKSAVTDALDERVLARVLRRSMPISTDRPTFIAS
jgi:hypothetical protein